MNSSIDRRTMVGLLTLGTAAFVTGCSDDGDGASSPTGSAKAEPKAAKLPPTLIWHGPRKGRQIAWTVDDGYDEATVAGYVRFAKTYGMPMTFLPNGAFQRVWARHADEVRPLIESGQVQFANHTFGHKNLRTLTDKQIAKEITKNEAWIKRTFGTSSKPYLRPPYGSRNARTDKIAADLGFSSILMWNATTNDEALISQKKLLQSVKNGLRPGAIVVAHANHKTILTSFDEVQDILEARDLHPVTLDTMFGTTRPA